MSLDLASRRIRALAAVADASAGLAEAVANERRNPAVVCAVALRACHVLDDLARLGRRSAMTLEALDGFLDLVAVPRDPKR